MTDQIIENRFLPLEAIRTSNKELSQVYELIRDMIKTQPKKRISLESVVMRLETLFPPSATSYDSKYRKDDQAPQDGDDGSSQKSSSTSQDIERGNVSGTESCRSLEKIDEVNFCS